MDTPDVIARLEADIASLRRQNQHIRGIVLLVALIALAPWIIAAGSQTAAKPTANTLTVDRLNLTGPNGQITLRSIEAVSTVGADNNRPAPALGIFAGTGMLFQVDGLAYTSASASTFLTQCCCLLLPWAVAPCASVATNSPVPGSTVPALLVLVSFRFALTR